MAEPIAEAFVEINARFDRLERELRGVRTRTDQTARRMERSFDRVGRAGRALQGTFRQVGALLGAVFAARAIRSSLDLADSLDKTSERLGVNVEELQRFRFAAEQAGVDVRTFDLALQRFTRRLGEAQRGTGEALNALRELSEIRGVDLFQLTPLEALDEIADAMAQIEEPTDRVRLAFKLFDSEGVRLLQLLGDGAAAMAELKQQADDLNIVLSATEIEGLVRAKDEFAALSGVLSTRFAKAVAANLPLIDLLSEGLLGLAEAAGVLFEDIRFMFEGPDLKTVEGLNEELERLDQKIGQLRGRPLELLTDFQLEVLVEAENQFEEVLAIRNRLLREGVPARNRRDELLNAEAIKDAEEQLFELTQERLKLEGRFDEVRQRQFERDIQEIEAIEGITERLREQLLLERQIAEIAAIEAEDTDRARVAAEADIERLEQLREKNAQVAEDIRRQLETAFSSAFDRILQDGKVTFDELGQALAQSLLETALQRVVTQISAALTSIFLPSTGAGLGALFGAASGAVIRKPTIVAAGEKGAEAIVPLDRLGELGGSTVVQVINGTPAATRTTEERMSDGRQLVRVLIGEVASDIASRGQVFRAIQGSAVGVRPRGVRR